MKENFMRKRVFLKVIILFHLFFLIPFFVHGAGGPERLFQDARSCYQVLKKSSAERKYRHNWLNCIKKYEKVVKKFPKSQRADDALFMVGKLYYRLYAYSSKRSDLNYAIDSYRKLTKRYPRSRFADDAQLNIAIIYKKKQDYSRACLEFRKVIDRYPRGDKKAQAAEYLKEFGEYRKPKPKKGSTESKDLVVVNGIRYWSNPDYTRVVIDMDNKTAYQDHILKPDPDIAKPPRLYLDIKNARLSRDMKETISINDGLLNRARVGQNRWDCVRVVLDIKTIKSYKVFPLINPFRIVIDVHGERKNKKIPRLKDPTASLARQLGLGIAKIVIDPGHGGRDPGAIGPTGLWEKRVVLKIAKKLEKRLKNDLGCEVVLTRRGDRFIPLEERTAIANTERADLFISIHANAHRKRSVCGIETYYLNLTTDESAIELAARENATSTRNISDLQMILNDLMLNSKINESSKLAEYVQLAICEKVGKTYSKVNNLGVKQAPFYVLIGAEMPSILIETSFISNAREEKRLKQEKYLNLIAEGILRGIKKYIGEIRQVS